MRDWHANLTAFKEATVKEAKKKMNGWYDWLVNHTPEPIKRRATAAFRFFKEEINSLYRETQPQKSETSLKGFSDTLTITPKFGVEPKVFLNNSKKGILIFGLIRSRQREE